MVTDSAWLSAIERANVQRDAFAAETRRRVEELHEEQQDERAAIIRLESTIGRAPDITRGDEGSGMARVVYQIANALIREGAIKPRAPSLPDWDESEITRSQSREDLLARTRRAELSTQRSVARTHAAAAVVVALAGGGVITAVVQWLLG